MPVITQIDVQKHDEDRRSVFIDGHFLFGCHASILVQHGWHKDLSVTAEDVQRVQHGEVHRECRDKALSYVARRLHSRAELQRKLARKEYGAEVIAAVLDDLAQTGIVDDTRFALEKARSAAGRKRQGQRRAYADILKTGVKRAVVTEAVRDIYSEHDSAAAATELARRQSEKWQGLDAAVRRRRIIGFLQRRGFDYHTAIKPAIEALGRP